MDADREAALAAFLVRAGWGAAARRPLAADASFRRYDRLHDRGGRRAVLMDAPPEKEDVRPFLAVAAALARLGYSVPAVMAADAEAGLVLLEDLGDDTYTRLIESGADPAPLYALAVDLLIDLHARPAETVVPAGTPPYDDARLLDEAALLIDWYAPEALGAPLPEEARAAYRSLWKGLLPLARAVPETLVLRDYHVDNLMRVPGRAGIGACGLLDFQDAVRGPTAYDFVSLIEDARRDVPPALSAALRARYRAAFPERDAAAFDLACTVLGAQRHCKVIGIFTRLWRRDGKPGYLRHIPRLWRLLEADAAHPALAPLRAWLDAWLPAPCRRVPDARPAA